MWVRTVTIRKGEPWGTAGALPKGGLVVTSDAEANQIINAAMRTNQEIPVLGLIGGDLARSLGATDNKTRLHTDDAQQLPLDLGVATFNGETHYFVAHMLLRRWCWQGRFVALMNTDFLGAYKLTPRAHPNDGLIDALDGSLSFNDRLKARKLAVTGEHLPHPDLSVRRAKEHHLLLDRATTVWLDGIKFGRTTEVRVKVLPDALLCVV